MDDDQLWKTRFHQLMLVRMAALALFVLGVALFTDLLREGGLPRIGAVLAIAGALVSVLAPRLLKKMWDRE